jgi:hypothetical protein
MPSRSPAAPEAAFQKAVTDLCDWLGLWWYHVTDSRKDKAGFPDLVIIGPHGARFRELKKADGKVSAEQAGVGARMCAAGLDWGVWWPADLFSGRIKDELEAIR